MIIREFTKKDYSYILEKETIFKDSIGFGFNKNHLNYIFNSENYILNIIETDKNEKIGYVLLGLEKKSSYKVPYKKLSVNTVYIEEKYRRKNIAYNVLNQSIKSIIYKFKDLYKIGLITAEIEEFNFASQKTFRKLGLKPSFKIINYYSDVNKNAFLYEKRIPF